MLFRSIHTLNNVLHIPTASTCLLSISKFTETRGYAQFTKDELKLFSANNTLLGVGNGTKGLYLMKAKATFPEEHAFPATSESNPDWNTWYRRFGHVGMSALKLMNSQGLVTGFDVDKSSTHNSDCAACIGAKMTRQPFLEINESRADLPGEKTHSDIWGPYRTQSLQGSIYFISFNDDYSRRITVRFMKQKLETEGFVRKYIEYAKSAMDNKPQAFKVDHATEYLKKSLVDWLEYHSIEIQVTAPYSHQQHGTSEQGNQTLLELARAMLLERKLPVFLWEEAIKHVAYI